MSSSFDRPQQKPASPSLLNRRRFLQFGVAAASSLLLPEAMANVLTGDSVDSLAGSISDNERKLSFLNLHTGESIDATYWAEGQYQSDELAAISRVLRDHRTGDVHDMDNGLLELLNTLHGMMDTDKPFQVISGFRSPKTNAALSKLSNGVAKKSLHMQGKAIDIRLPGCKLSDLRNAAIDCQAGGVGYYPKSDFIHVDTGNVRRWG